MTAQQVAQVDFVGFNTCPSLNGQDRIRLLGMAHAFTALSDELSCCDRKEAGMIIPAYPGFSLLQYSFDYDTVYENPVIAWDFSQKTFEEVASHAWGPVPRTAMGCVSAGDTGLRQPDGTVINLYSPGIVYPDRGYWHYKQIELKNSLRETEEEDRAKDQVA